MATRIKETLSEEGMLERYGLLGLAALRNPMIWEIIGGGPGGGLGHISAGAKKQLQSELSEVYGALLKNAKDGDALSGAIATQVALRKAALH